MKLQNANAGNALLVMNYEELTAISLCVADIKDRMNDSEDETIIGINRGMLRALAKELNNIKDLVGRSN